MSILSQPITLATIFGSNRMIDSITVQCVISEDTNDTLTITKQPIQNGAPITDHAYKEPTAFSMSILQQNNTGFLPTGLLDFAAAPGNGGLAQIYQQFLALQLLRQPFNVLTPKRVYKNLLMSTLRQHTDKTTENILSLSVSFQEVFLVNVGTLQVPASRQANAGITQGTQNIGKQSALYSLKQAVNNLTVGLPK